MLMNSVRLSGSCWDLFRVIFDCHAKPNLYVTVSDCQPVWEPVPAQDASLGQHLVAGGNHPLPLPPLPDPLCGASASEYPWEAGRIFRTLMIRTCVWSQRISLCPSADLPGDPPALVPVDRGAENFIPSDPPGWGAEIHFQESPWRYVEKYTWWLKMRLLEVTDHSLLLCFSFYREQPKSFLSHPLWKGILFDLFLLPFLSFLASFDTRASFRALHDISVFVCSTVDEEQKYRRRRQLN